MQTTITADLPFSWCVICGERTMQTEKIYAEGEVFDSRTSCENEAICMAAERARRKAEARQ